MRSNIALSYLAMLSVAGFFLWLINNVIRSLRQKNQAIPVMSFTSEPPDADKKPVDWPVHIFLSKTDDIPVPGRLLSITSSGAFMLSSACLKTGQAISLYVEIPGCEQVQLSARVTWARAGRDGRNAAQLVFDSQSSAKHKELFSLCDGAK